MRYSKKHESVQSEVPQLFSVDFHDFISKQKNADSMEMASEFGLNLREVKELKQKLGRS